MRASMYCGPVVALCILVQVAQAYNILLICPSINSQVVVNVQMARALVTHGHDVTIVKSSTMKMPSDLQDPRITIETYENEQLSIEEDPVLQKELMKQQFSYSIANMFSFLSTMSSRVGKANWDLFNDAGLRQRLKTSKFDFAIMSPPIGHVYTLLVYDLGIPYAYMGMECLFSWMWLPSSPPNYVPNPFIPGLSDRMTLSQKLVNTAVYLGMAVSQSFSPSASSVHQHVPDRPPVSFNQLQRNASLCLRTKVSVVDFPRPNLPNVIDVGNMMLRDVQPLPLNIQQFLDDSTDGAILVSFGSIVDQVPDELISNMVEAFMKMKYRILWKKKSPMKVDLPNSKFLVLPWTPQVDVLNHQNIRVFVSHCGYGSLLESVSQGVPLVCLPFMTDQYFNAHFMALKGFGKVIEPAELTPRRLMDAVQAVATGPERDAIERASAIIRDLPSDGDKAVFWVEHVIKHGGGHLRSSMMDMPLWEYLMVDVVSVMVVTALLLLFILYWTCRLICRGCYCCSCCCDCCRKKPKPGKSKNKTE